LANIRETTLKAFNALIEPAFSQIPPDIQIQLLALAATERLLAMDDINQAEHLCNVLTGMFEKLTFGSK